MLHFVVRDPDGLERSLGVQLLQSRPRLSPERRVVRAGHVHAAGAGPVDEVQVEVRSVEVGERSEDGDNMSS